MKKLILLIAVMMTGLTAFSQGYYTKECKDSKERKRAAKWVRRGEWRNGFEAASPHKSVNNVEFMTQYLKNTAQWEAMFRWLASNNLVDMPKGKYPIEGTTLVASVEESSNSELEKRRSESHYHHIDFQYVVKGTERFGIIDHVTSKPNCDYKPDVMHYDYNVGKTLFYDSTPDSFFVFFPSDWHIAKVKTEKEDQSIKVVVVKLDYIP